MKKILGKTLLLAGVVALGIFAGGTLVNAQTATQGFGGNAGGVENISGLGVTSGSLNNSTGEMGLLKVVKKFINRVLGLLSLIALGMALYGGFQMVTSAGDDGKYKDGFKVLKNAAIGLIVVGLSWIIVSSIFWLINFGTGTGTSGSTLN